jgi:hypothetical protein
MAEKTMAQKLSLKPGMRVLLINAPLDVEPLLAPLPEGTSFHTAGDGPWDAVMAFCHNRADADLLVPQAIAVLKPGGLLWMAYPKVSGSREKPDLTRDRGWRAIVAANYGPVGQVALNDRWTLMRFRPEADVSRTGTIGGWHAAQLKE